MLKKAPGSPRLIVLVAPGGTDRSYRPFSPWQSSALRMYPFTWSIRLRFGRAVLVRQLRYRVYGWNGGQASPMPYARAALDEVTAAHPGVPVVVLGHSMGGRVAAHLAADRRVIGVLGLAPWWQYADWRFINPAAQVWPYTATPTSAPSPVAPARGSTNCGHVARGPSSSRSLAAATRCWITSRYGTVPHWISSATSCRSCAESCHAFRSRRGAPDSSSTNSG